jgi:hypothetical protein
MKDVDTTSKMQHPSPTCPIRPWPIPNADRGPKSIAEYIAQVNRAYPGGFRAVDIDTVGEDAKEADEEADTDMDGAGAGEDEGGADASATKDPLEARNETLYNIVYVESPQRSTRLPDRLN